MKVDVTPPFMWFYLNLFLKAFLKSPQAHQTSSDWSTAVTSHAAVNSDARSIQIFSLTSHSTQYRSFRRWSSPVKDAFAAIQQLRQKCATSSAPLKDLNGKLLSDRTSTAASWQEQQYPIESAHTTTSRCSSIWSHCINSWSFHWHLFSYDHGDLSTERCGQPPTSLSAHSC